MLRIVTTALRTDDPAPARLWRSRDYLAWLASDTSAALASAVYAFAVPLMTLIVTGDPAQAGLVAGAGALGRVAATVPGGVVADRHDRRLLMVVGGLAGAVLVGSLAVAHLAGALGFWPLLLLNLALGVRTGLFGAASDAALKAVVEPRQLPAAMSANQGRDATIALGAGPAGGALLAGGVVLPLLATVAGFVTAALTALGIRTDLRPGAGEHGAPEGETVARRGMVAEAREGLAWLWRRPQLRGVLGVATLLNLGLNAALTTLVLALQQDGVSPAAIGLVSLTLGGGMLLGSLVAPALLHRFPTGLLASGGLLLAVAAFLVLPWVDGLPAVLVVLGLGILGAPVTNAGLGGYLTAAVPQRFLGRVNSAAELLSLAAVPLAPVVAGFGLSALGRQGTLLVCAGVCLAAAALVVGNRSLRRLPGPEGWAELS